MAETALYNESETLRLVAEGDESAFRELYDQYSNKVFYIARELLSDEVSAEDVLQEVFVKVWLHREEMPGVLNFKAWLNTVTRNQIFTVFRKLAGEDGVLRELAGRDQSTSSENPEDRFAVQELQESLRLAMEHLTPQQKKVFTLSRLEGLKLDEIAARLSLSKPTVKKHISDALRTIRRELGNHPTAVQFGIMLFFLSV